MYVDPSAFVLTDGVSKADSSLKNDVLNLNLLMALISAPDGNVKYPGFPLLGSVHSLRFSMDCSGGSGKSLQVGTSS